MLSLVVLDGKKNGSARLFDDSKLFVDYSSGVKLKNAPIQILVTSASNQLRQLLSDGSLPGGDLVKVYCPHNHFLVSTISALLFSRYLAIAFYNHSSKTYVVTYAAANSNYKIAQSLQIDGWYVMKHSFGQPPSPSRYFIDCQDAADFVNDDCDQSDALAVYGVLGI